MPDQLALPVLRLRDVILAVAEEHGACTRPVQLRKTSLATGQAEQVLVPCGATLASKCGPCAERNKTLRAAQCREGWHLEHEPSADPEPPGDWPKWLAAKRADLQADRDHAQASGHDTAEADELIDAVDEEIADLGIRGTVPRDGNGSQSRRRRSTRRRGDAPSLPSRRIDPRTVGRTYTGPDGKTWRPSMFVTITCPSYGKVASDGVPADPRSYDYQSAARDAIHFAALFDRFIQNLRRCLGYDVQYFAAVEPQRRLAAHVHIAIRGTLPRSELRKVIAATYHQVWWPSTGTVRFGGDHMPVWHEPSGRYLDPATGELLPAWDEALDSIKPDEEPLHVARLGDRFDAQGVIAGSKDSARCISYLTKYLVKDVGSVHAPQTDAQRDHVARLAQALRYEPCSPTCANWLRYGITPKNPRKGLIPGACKGKAHRPDHLGYAGRRVLVSRKWSGKTLAAHRASRKAWLMTVLGLDEPDDRDRYRWERVTASDRDYLLLSRRLVRVVADRMRWKQALDQARRLAQDQAVNADDLGRAA